MYLVRKRPYITLLFCLLSTRKSLYIHVFLHVLSVFNRVKLVLIVAIKYMTYIVT
jgi:Na+/H+ antiporter NhaA